MILNNLILCTSIALSFRLMMCFMTPSVLPISKLTKPNFEKYVNIILNDILSENRDDLLLLRKECESLIALSNSISKAEVLSQIDGDDNDSQTWNEILRNLPLDSSWANAPTLILDYYFYRRIVASLKYRETNFDPFINRKVMLLKSNMPYVEYLTSRIPELLDLPVQSAVEFLILGSLWGNKLHDDLSATIASSSGTRKRFSVPDICSSASSNIISNDLSTAVEILTRIVKSSEKQNSSKTPQSSPRDVDIILGVAGPELAADLFLGHMLLRFGCCDRVTFHCKPYPVGGEATNRDFFAAIQTMANPSSSDVWSVRTFGTAAKDHYLTGEFVLQEDLFWCQPTAMWDMPEAVQSKLATSGLVVVKGDANYRRLLGDRQWALDTPAREVLGYWAPIPVCVLRRIECDTLCGVDCTVSRRASVADRNWMSSGDWAVLQVVENGDGVAV